MLRYLGHITREMSVVRANDRSSKQIKQGTSGHTLPPSQRHSMHKKIHMRDREEELASGQIIDATNWRGAAEHSEVVPPQARTAHRRVYL